jgi:hypothetical protein
MPSNIPLAAILFAVALTATPSWQPAAKPWAIAIVPMTSPAAVGGGRPE